jgi:hypothetical protein
MAAAAGRLPRGRRKRRRRRRRGRSRRRMVGRIRIRRVALIHTRFHPTRGSAGIPLPTSARSAFTLTLALAAALGARTLGAFTLSFPILTSAQVLLSPPPLPFPLRLQALV